MGTQDQKKPTEKPDSHRLLRGLSRASWVVQIPVALVLFGWIVVQVALRMGPVQNLVRSLITGQVDSLLYGTLHYRTLRTDLFTSARVEDVVIRAEGRPDSLTARFVEVRFTLPLLLQRRIRLESIQARDVHLFISQPPTKVAPLFFLPRKRPEPEDPEPSPWKFEIGTSHAEPIDATYRDTALALTARMQMAIAKTRFSTGMDTILTDLQVALGEVGSPWWAGEVDTLYQQGRILSSKIVVDRMMFSGEGTRIQAEGTISFARDSAWDLRATAISDLDPIVVLRTIPQLAASGTLNAHVSWQGPLINPDLNADIRALSLVFEDQQVDSLIALARYYNDSLRLDAAVQGPMAALRLNGSGRIRDLLTDPIFGPYHAQVNLSRARIHHLLPQPVNERLSGAMLTGEGSVRGSGLAFPSFVGLQTRIAGGALLRVPLALNASLQEQAWNLAAFWGGNRVSGQGTYSVNERISGRAVAYLNEPQIITQPFLDQTVTGAIQGEATLIGTLQSPLVTFSASSDELHWETLTVSQLSGSARYGPEGITITDSRARIQGEIGPVLAALGIDTAGGVINATVQASGPADNLLINASVQAADPLYREFSASSVEGSLRLQGWDSISWTDLTVSRGDTSAVTTGSLVLGEIQSVDAALLLRTGRETRGRISACARITPRTLTGSADIDDLDLSVLDPWIPLPEPVGALVDARILFEGSLSNPAADISASITDPRYGPYNLGAIHGQARFSDSILDLRATVHTREPESILSVDGRLPLLPGQGWSVDTTGAKAGTLHISSDTLLLQSLETLLPDMITAQGIARLDASATLRGGDWELDGSASVDTGIIVYFPLDITASGVHLQSGIDGSLASPVIDFRVQTGTVELQQQQVDSSFWKGSLRGDTVRIDTGFALFANGGTARIRGNLPLKAIDTLLNPANPGLEFELTRVPLRTIAPFVPGLSISAGILEGSGSLVIENGRLISDGEMQLRGGVFRIDGFEEEIGPVDGRVVFAGDSILIRNVQGRLGEGRVSAQGVVTLSGRNVPRVFLDITAQNAGITLEEVGVVRIRSAQVQLASDQDRYRFSGTVDLGETRITRDYGITELLNLARPEGPPTQPNPLLQRTDLQIDLRLNRNLLIDMNPANVQLDGELAISGTAAAPGFVGEIRIMEGFINYLDRQFDVTRGTITLIDPEQFNPLFNITAVSDVIAVAAGSAQTVSYTVQLVMTGDLERPEIVLTSTPPLDEPNILSVLTLGTTLGGVGGDLAARIGSLAGQKLLGFGTRPLQQLLGLESIRVTGDIFGAGDESGPQVTLTRRITRRLTLTYQTRLTDPGEYTISALLRLFPFLFIVGETGRVGQSNISVRVRFSR